MELELKKIIVEALKGQQAILGDDLFEVTNFNFSFREKKEEKISFSKFEKDVVDNPSVEKSLQPFSTNASTIDEFSAEISNCDRCKLASTRNKFVFGEGNSNADLMLIGEGPGAEEDAQGIPFVGKAGKLLNDILKAINFKREEVYIANIVKCRPPNNRNPLPEEIAACIPYLHKQIEFINPKIILCLGLVAATSLLETKNSLTKMRGNEYDLNGRIVMVTYHPAALLRNPGWKRGCWEDVQKLRKLYDSLMAN